MLSGGESRAGQHNEGTKETNMNTGTLGGTAQQLPPSTIQTAHGELMATLNNLEDHAAKLFTVTLAPALNKAKLPPDGPFPTPAQFSGQGNGSAVEVQPKSEIASMLNEAREAARRVQAWLNKIEGSAETV